MPLEHAGARTRIPVNVLRLRVLEPPDTRRRAASVPVRRWGGRRIPIPQPLTRRRQGR